MNGLSHISLAFTATKTNQRAAFMPYFTLGYPNLEASLDIIQSIADSGADMIELGVPFSDPLADGPTIQHSTQVAHENGATAARCLELVSRLRSRGVEQPLILMSYINPVLAYGVDRFVSDACSAGADGLIIPDQPLEEAAGMETSCQSHSMALVFMIAPTSTPARLAENAARTSGFLYLVSLAGVTGARSRLPSELESFIQRTLPYAHTPVAVGFGISTPEQARLVGRLADGVIVGSALIKAVEGSTDPCRAAGNFVRSFRLGLGVSP